MELSSVTVKGQVVIPVELRRKFGIIGGTRVGFYEVEGEIRLVPITEEFVEQQLGFLGTKGKLGKLLAQDKKREREL